MTEAVVAERRRVSAIWLVPIVALVLGLSVVIYTVVNQGPEIRIEFGTADGLEAGKTKIRARSVEVGLVDEVMLNEDLESVTVVAQLDPVARSLLREDTQFWVVRPRVGLSGVSGLGTLLSGAYIELEPGSGAKGRRDFAGLEDVPVTEAGTPGLRLVLLSEQAGSVGPGNPVLYRGYRVGRVEEADFDPEGRRVRYAIFIDAPYDELVNRGTRFWNASGIALRTSAGGIELEMGSLESLVAGGVAFDLPQGSVAGGPVEYGAEFTLHGSRDAASEPSYRHGLDYVVSFVQSTRGLSRGAPVEYRGIPVGAVQRILLEELTSQSGPGGTGLAIPVLVHLEPARLGLPDSEEGAAWLRQAIEIGVENGLRAALQSGNLITGSLLISLDYFPEEGAAEVGTFGSWQTLPSISGGFARIERQVAQLLDKLNRLPLEQTVLSADGTLKEFESTLAELRTLVASFSPQSPLHEDLRRAVTELNRTLQEVRKLSRTVEQQPNSVIFSKPIEPDPEPRVER